MMKITAVLLTTLGLISCSMVEGVFQKKESARITVTLQKHQGYCGGARPTPEMEKGTITPIANETYYFKNRITQDLTEVVTDASGLINLKLERGNYQVYMGDKIDLTFEEFYAKYQMKGENFENEGETCFRTFYSVPTWEVKVHSDSTFTLTTNIGCYTDGNPCVKYIGPHRP